MPEVKKPADDPQGEPDPKTVEPEAKAPESAAPQKLDLTQAEFDAIVADRVKRAKPKDYDELVALRDKVTAEEDAKKDELTREKDARKVADQKAADREVKANEKLRKAAIIAEATAQNAADNDIVVALLMGSDGIEVDDDGEVTGAKEAVKKLLKDKPVLAKGALPGTSGGEFGGNPNKTIDERIAEAEKSGSIADRVRLKLSKGLSAPTT